MVEIAAEPPKQVEELSFWERAAVSVLLLATPYQAICDSVRSPAVYECGAFQFSVKRWTTDLGEWTNVYLTAERAITVCCAEDGKVQLYQWVTSSFSPLLHPGEKV